MTQPSRLEAVDRHALVMAIWLPAGLIAVTLLHCGIDRGSAAFILGAFGLLVAAFIGHVLVNAAYGRDFSLRERALGLVLYVVALLAFCIAALTRPAVLGRSFVPVCGGLVLLCAVVVFTMLTRYGTRGAFTAFDVIRDFRAEAGASASEAESRE